VKYSNKVQQPHRTVPAVCDQQSLLACVNDRYRLRAPKW